MEEASLLIYLNLQQQYYCVLAGWIRRDRDNKITYYQDEHGRIFRLFENTQILEGCGSYKAEVPINTTELMQKLKRNQALSDAEILQEMEETISWLVPDRRLLCAS